MPSSAPRCRSSASRPAWAIAFANHAGVHVNYQETKLRIKDGLPKMKDMPEEMGGSGVSIAE
jgi:hypothetical protein